MVHKNFSQKWGQAAPHRQSPSRLPVRKIDRGIGKTFVSNKCGLENNV